MTVNDELTSLLDGASKASAQNQSIKTHFQELNQVFTGQTCAAACLFEDVTHLRLADAVLCTKTLLFLQTNRVVRFLTATATAVFTGAVRTLLEVANCLRGECEAKGAGLAHLLA